MESSKNNELYTPVHGLMKFCEEFGEVRVDFSCHLPFFYPWHFFIYIVSIYWFPSSLSNHLLVLFLSRDSSVHHHLVFNHIWFHRIVNIYQNFNQSPVIFPRHSEIPERINGLCSLYDIPYVLQLWIPSCEKKWPPSMYPCQKAWFTNTNWNGFSSILFTAS